MGQPYHLPQEPEEPSGCMQSFVILKVLLGILAIPIAVLMGVMTTFVAAIFLYTVNPLLALFPLGLIVAAIFAFARWENARAERERPREDDYY
jgi:hypothetical protein